MKATPQPLPHGTPSAAGMDPARLERAVHVVAGAIRRGEIPGAVLYVARRGQVVLHRALGWAQLYPEEERRPMRPDTLFDLASLTKVVATLPAILLLMEAGEIRLDDRLVRWWPAFGEGGKDGITVRHLLTHTAGLPAGTRLHGQGWGKEEILAHLFSLPLSHPPGTRVLYSDIGPILLAELVSLVAGMPFDRFCREHIFAPLGMAETGFNPPAALRPRIAATEYREHLGRHQVGEVHDQNAAALGGVAGHAGLFSTAADLGRYMQLWLNEGVLDGVRLLSPLTVRLALQNHTEGLGEPRGLGWLVRGITHSSAGDIFSRRSFGHTGFTGTSAWADPETGLLALLLTNRVHLGRTEHILRLRPLFYNAVAAAVVEG